MTAWIGPARTRHRASIAGRVMDAVTARDLEGVEVTVTPDGHQHAVAKAMTARDGTFCFTDLPAGRYQVSARAPRHGSRYGKGTISVVVASPLDAVAPGVQETIHAILLPPTGMQGQVCPSPRGPVPYPLLRLVGSGERGYGDAEGNFQLLGIEAGRRQLLITAPGYRPLLTEVQVNAGEMSRGIKIEIDKALANLPASDDATGESPRDWE